MKHSEAVREKTKLVKKYHALCTQLNMKEHDRHALLSAWGVKSSTELGVEQLSKVCEYLDARVNGHINQWRKRVMASIFGYYMLLGKEVDRGYVIATACRAAGEFTNFNRVPMDRLQAVYYAFVNRQNTIKKTGLMLDAELDNLAQLN